MNRNHPWRSYDKHTYLRCRVYIMPEGVSSVQSLSLGLSDIVW